MMPTLLIAESKGFSQAALDILNRTFTIHLCDLERGQLLQEVRTADVLWVRLRNRIDAEVIDCAPRLACIVSPTTGLNHIDLEKAAAKSINVISLKREGTFLQNIRATAEHTISLILCLLRSTHLGQRHVLSGGWNRDLFWGHELYRKTAGILGYGRLGRIVGSYLQAFGMQVLICDPHIEQHSIPANVSRVDLDTLLRDSDVLSIHVDYRPERHGFFGVREFAMMKSGAWFINTSRGELVNEEALLRALETSKLSGAALDVLANESSMGMGHNLLVQYAQNHENLIITPHIGGCTIESREQTEVFLALKLCELMKGTTAQA